MTVVKAWLAGQDAVFLPNAKASDTRNLSAVPGPLRAILRDHLSINSTAVVVLNDKGVQEVKGSKTEGAGLLLVQVGRAHSRAFT